MAGETGGVSEEDEAPAIDFVPLATMVVDGEGGVLAANPAWLQLSGLTERGTLGHGWQTLIPARDRLRLLLTLRRVAERGGTETFDQELALERGARWTRWTLRRHDRRGRPVVVAVLVDLDAEHNLQMDLRHRATHDALTGLVNRGEFLELVARAMGRRYGRVGVVYLDLDRFKDVNDEGGHQLGDRVLAAAARRLRAGVRPSDVVGRVGGDEFAVLCQDLHRLDSLEAVARRLRAVLKAPLEIEGVLRRIGATTGVAVSYPGCSPEQALDAADRAMYAAKSRRRARLQAVVPAEDPPGNPDQSLGPPSSALRPDRPGRPGGGGEELRQHLLNARVSLESCAMSAPEVAVDDLWAAIDEVDTVLAFLPSAQSPSGRGARSHPAAGR